jgi:tetratricopeptide (TPR) repeat protein
VRILRTALLVLTLPALATLTTPLLAETLEQAFQRGNTAYEQGRYVDAVRAYRGILRYRVKHPVVEYNLANAEFKLNNLGTAILHYHRALRMDPTDPEILGNLEYANSFCQDRVELPEQAAVVRWLRAAQNRLGSRVQAWLALGLLWAAAGVAAWRLSRPGGWSGRYGWLLATLILAAALSSISAYDTWKQLDGRHLAVVQNETVDVLAGPGPNNLTLFTVHEGLTLEVRSVREGWLKIRLPNGLNGWVDARALGIV